MDSQGDTVATFRAGGQGPNPGLFDCTWEDTTASHTWSAGHQRGQKAPGRSPPRIPEGQRTVPRKVPRVPRTRGAEGLEMSQRPGPWSPGCWRLWTDPWQGTEKQPLAAVVPLPASKASKSLQVCTMGGRRQWGSEPTGQSEHPWDIT